MANSSAYRLEFVLCKNTGEPISTVFTAKVRKLSYRLNTPATCQIDLPIFDVNLPQVTPGSARAKVWRSASPLELAINPAATKRMVFYGSLPAENYHDNTDEASLIFRDPRWVWESRFTSAPVTYTGNSGSIAAAVEAVEEARQSLWMTVGGSLPTLTSRTLVYDQGKRVSEIIQELVEATGGMDLDFTPADFWPGSRQMGSIAHYVREGTDLPNCVFFYKQQADGKGGGNVTSVDRTFSPLVTRATAAGTNSAGIPIKVAVSAAPAVVDLLESFTTAGDGQSSTTLTEQAQGVIDEQGTIRPAYSLGEVTWEGPQPFTDYNLGDTVRLSVVRGPMQIDRAVVRVHGFDIEVDQEGNVKSVPILVGS